MKLTVEGCRTRQRLLVELLAERGLAGAVMGEREYVYYFSGHPAGESRQQGGVGRRRTDGVRDGLPRHHAQSPAGDG